MVNARNPKTKASNCRSKAKDATAKATDTKITIQKHVVITVFTVIIRCVEKKKRPKCFFCNIFHKTQGESDKMR